MLVKKKSAAQEKKKVKYQPLTTEYMNERKNQQGSDRDSYVAGHVKFFSPAAGDNTVRIMPGTWEAEVPTYGYELYVHYGIGPDQSAYLCNKSMKDEDCPICEERATADKAGDAEYAKQLRPNKRIAVYVIDRAKEGEGPKLWAMPYTLEREIAAQAIDKKTAEVIQFIDPEAGFDLSFTKQGKDMQTKYVGVSFDRKPSPLSDDEETGQAWLDFIVTNPLPEQLTFYEAEHIADVFSGGKSKKEEAGEEKTTAKKPDGGKPKFGSKKKTPELPTYEEVMALDEAGLTALTEAHSVDLSGKEFETMEEAAAATCEALGIEAPKKEAGKPKFGLGKKKEEPPEPPTWEEVHAIEDGDELTTLADKHSVDLAGKEFDTVEEAQDAICEALGIEAPKTAAGKPKLTLG